MVNLLKVEKALELKNSVLIDTRTPKEYNESHIPGAINAPILSNDERHIIGLLYRKNGSEAAIEKGKELFIPRIDEYLKYFKQYKNKNLVVYCSRGGMRSKVITEILENGNYNAIQLENGYKAYRNYILNKLNNYHVKPRLIVIHGLTGTRKTKIIQKINMPKIDLEGIAQHRSSLFGGIGLIPRNQKMFENLLFHEFKKLENTKYIIIEGESRKVGNSIIPEKIYQAMKGGLHVKIECSMNVRINHIVEEYLNTPEKIEQVKQVIPKLKQSLTKKIVDELMQQMENRQYNQVTETILIRYYDPKYSFSLDEIKYDLVIKNDDINQTIIELIKFIS